MTQRNLFDPDPEPATVPDAQLCRAGVRVRTPPLARRTDPATSQIAAEQIASTVAQLEQWAAECVRAAPGLTQRELGARFCPDDLRRIGRRLCEAARKGLIRRGPSRPCSITGRTAETWEPMETKK